MSKYNLAKDQSAANTSLKIVNISVNVNTWRPPHYQEPRDAAMDNQKSVQNNEGNAGRFGAKLMKEVSKPVSVGNGNVRWSRLPGFFILLAFSLMKSLAIPPLH